MAVGDPLDERALEGVRQRGLRVTRLREDDGIDAGSGRERRRPRRLGKDGPVVNAPEDRRVDASVAGRRREVAVRRRLGQIDRVEVGGVVLSAVAGDHENTVAFGTPRCPAGRRGGRTDVARGRRDDGLRLCRRRRALRQHAAGEQRAQIRVPLQ